MSKYLRLAFAAATTAVVLGALAGVASANRLSASTQTFTATWARMNFNGAFGIEFTCPVTLSGSLHSRTATKTNESLIGFINEANIASASCAGSVSVTVLRATLPWHIRYRTFAGTLPNITSIVTLLVGASFQISVFNCLFRTDATEPATLVFNREGGGRISSVGIGGTIESDNGCIFGGNTAMTLSGTSSTVSAVTVSLI